MDSPPASVSMSSAFSSTVRSVFGRLTSRRTPIPKNTSQPSPSQSQSPSRAPSDSPLPIPQTQMFSDHSTGKDWKTVRSATRNVSTSKSFTAEPFWHVDHQRNPLGLPCASTPLESTGEVCAFETYFEDFDNENDPLSGSKTVDHETTDHDSSQPPDPLHVRNGSGNLSSSCTPDSSVVVSDIEDGEDGRPPKKVCTVQDTSPIQQNQKHLRKGKSLDSRRGDEDSDKELLPGKKRRKLHNGKSKNTLTRNESIFMEHTWKPLIPAAIRKPHKPIHINDDDDFLTGQLCTQVASFPSGLNKARPEGKRENRLRLGKIIESQNKPVPKNVEMGSLKSASPLIRPPAVTPTSNASGLAQNDSNGVGNWTRTSQSSPIDPMIPEKNLNRTEGRISFLGTASNSDQISATDFNPRPKSASPSMDRDRVDVVEIGIADNEEQECIEVSAIIRPSYPAPRTGSGRVERRSTIDGIIAERGSPNFTRSTYPLQGRPYSNSPAASKNATGMIKNRRHHRDVIEISPSLPASPLFALSDTPRKEANWMHNGGILSSEKVRGRAPCSTTVPGASVKQGNAQISDSRPEPTAGSLGTTQSAPTISFPLFYPKTVPPISPVSSMPWSRGNTPPPQDGGGYLPVRVGPDRISLSSSPNWADPLYNVFRQQWQDSEDAEMFTPTVGMMEWWNDRAWEDTR